MSIVLTMPLLAYWVGMRGACASVLPLLESPDPRTAWERASKEQLLWLLEDLEKVPPHGPAEPGCRRCRRCFVRDMSAEQLRKEFPFADVEAALVSEIGKL